MVMPASQTKKSLKRRWVNILLSLALLLIVFSVARSIMRPASSATTPILEMVKPTEQVVKPTEQVAQPAMQVQAAPGEPLTATFSHVDFSKRDCKDTLTSQHGEDKFLYSAFWSSPSPMTNGFYLELGAYDGVGMSNTHWLDKCLGWSGLLIEGHPVSVEKLKVNRPNADILGEAICEEEGTVTFVGKDDGVAGDVSRMPADFVQAFHRNWKLGIEEVHNVTCGPLSTRLADRGIKHIDFWTLDVEGAEWSVLNTFDWGAVTVHVLVIENDKDEAKDKDRRHKYLVDKGFELRGILANNELWVDPRNARANMKERAVMFQGFDYLGIEVV